VTEKPTAIGRLVSFSLPRAWQVIAVSLALALAAAAYAAGHFKMTTDTAQLISADVSWRQHEIAFDNAFPQLKDSIIVVVDGRTPELAERGAVELTDKLATRKDLLLGVDRPDGGPFWDREGLLLLPPAEVQHTMDQLIAAQPFLGPLAADPSLRGVMTSLQTLMTGVRTGAAKLEDIDRPVKALAVAMQSAADGAPTFFSWQTLFSGAGGLSQTRKFVIVRPKLDYSALEPGAAASEAIRRTAGAAGLDPAHGITVRLTGPVPLSDEEFASLADRAGLMVSVMLGAVLLMLWLAVRSARVTAAIMITTLIGLVMTAGLGLATVGRFNLISVAFIPLFVGLGVDFGIQFAVKYRAESRVSPDRDQALIAAGRGVGASLALAAAAIAAGFFAFLPTRYVGVSELGMIAGLGMGIAFLLSVTLLPALLHVLKPPVLGARGGFEALGPVDMLMHRRRWRVLLANGALALICVALLPLVRFDSNPLDLKDPKSESMATLSDLLKDPDRSPNTIDILTSSLTAADGLAARLEKSPLVSHAVTLSSFTPPDQAPKLAAISDADMLLDLTLNPLAIQPPPSDAELDASLKQTAGDLRAAAGAGGSAGQDALRLAVALERLANADPARRAAAQSALVQPLQITLDQLRLMLQAQPLSRDTLPPDFVSQWVAAGGRARVQVFPKGGVLDDAGIKRFAQAVQSVAPNASGGPVSIVEAGKTIVQAFRQAGLWSLIAITILLSAVLRRFRDVVYTVLPVMLTGLLTLGTCVIVGQPINFANIIALPLLFGIGVAFHIYLVMAWRAGEAHFLTSSLTRAVVFSALTTGLAFGALAISRHPGTASMGRLLMISLAYTLATALFFGPALMGPPPKRTGV
jgi:hopanoid biosynthesis associated RND transporter like protein HpnN